MLTIQTLKGGGGTAHSYSQEGGVEGGRAGAVVTDKDAQLAQSQSDESDTDE